MRFPGRSGWFAIAWRSVREHFNRIGETALITAIENSIVNPDKSGGFMLEWLYLGIVTSTNSLESDNKQFERRILEELKRIEPGATLPSSIGQSMRVIEGLWKELSDPSHFDVFWSPNDYEKRSAQQFLRALEDGRFVWFVSPVDPDDPLTIVIAF
jgi:hypothetical protein